MAIRYYWGFGVGHVYAHGRRDSVPVMGDASEEDEDDDAEVAEGHEVPVTAGPELAITGDILDPGSRAPSVASDSDNEVMGDSDEAMGDSDEEENTQSEEEETYR